MGVKDAFCPACQSPMRAGSFAVRGAGFGIIGCSGCGLEMRWPQLQLDELAGIYDERYYDAWGFRPGDRALRRMKMQSFRAFLSLLPAPDRGDRLLDVGCAMGYLLEAAAERGWEPYGVEISPFSARIASRRFGNRICQGTVETSPFPPAFFKAVTMCDVIEHVPDLHAFIAGAAQLLVPGGFLLVITPNAASISRRLMGALWPHILSEHLWYLTPISMKRVLYRHNLRIRKVGVGSEHYTLDYLIDRFSAYTPCKGLGRLVRSSRRLVPTLFRKTAFVCPSGKLYCLAVRAGQY